MRDLKAAWILMFNILERWKEWLHPIYSMLNSVSKGKYSFNLKQYSRVTILLKSFDVEINQKG